MAQDPNGPRVLLSTRNEVEAGSVATALAAYDIEASITGGFTSGFRAEAPGDVQVLVRASDLDRAKKALAEIRAEQNPMG
ncbi:MAG: putative signal transducing protein [Pirellulales bacterium]